MAVKPLKTCWRVDLQHKGDRIRETFDTEEDALEREKELKAAFKKGNKPVRHSDSANGEPTLKTLFDLTARHVWSKQKSLRQQKNAEKFIDNCLDWNAPCTCITTLVLDEITLRLYEKGLPPKKPGKGGVPLSPSTVNRYKAALSRILRTGREYGLTTHHPAIRMDKEGDGRERVLSYEEEEKLLPIAVKYHPMYPDFIQYLLKTGMRLEEARCCHIDRVVCGRITLDAKETKNGKSRTIPLDRVGALQHLEKWKHFKHIGHTMLYKWWKKIRVEMGVQHDKEFVYHMLRHTCATRMLDRGVPLQLIQVWLGHLDLKTTQRYAHIRESKLDEVADLMREDYLEKSHGRSTEIQNLAH